MRTTGPHHALPSLLRAAVSCACRSSRPNRRRASRRYSTTKTFPAGTAGPIHAKGGTPADIAKLSAEDRAKKFDEWTTDSKKHWSVDKDELVNDGNGAYLATEKEYGDIELLVEYKTVAKADSGIYLRNTPQVQIWGRRKKAGSGTSAPTKVPGRCGTTQRMHRGNFRWCWRTSRSASGTASASFRSANAPRFTSTINSWSITLRMENYWDRKSPLPKTGKILLQTHGGEIRWRNVFIREIPSAEANEILRQATTRRASTAFSTAKT